MLHPQGVALKTSLQKEKEGRARVSKLLEVMQLQQQQQQPAATTSLGLEGLRPVSDTVATVATVAKVKQKDLETPSAPLPTPTDSSYTACNATATAVTSPSVDHQGMARHTHPVHLRHGIAIAALHLTASLRNNTGMWLA